MGIEMILANDVIIFICQTLSRALRWNYAVGAVAVPTLLLRFSIWESLRRRHMKDRSLYCDGTLFLMSSKASNQPNTGHPVLSSF